MNNRPLRYKLVNVLFLFDSHKLKINTHLKLHASKELIESLPSQLYGECLSKFKMEFSNPSYFPIVDEAVMLCQDSENSWLAWIPEHGEIILRTI